MMTQQTWLLADDHHVLYHAGTHRVLNQPQRHIANPLLAPDKPWEVAIAWNSIYYNPETHTYQLWYQAYTGRNVQDKRYGCVVCYAESQDGIHFTKPDLDIYPFQDIPKTNIVLIGNGGHSYRYCNSVLVDQKAPNPKRRYKMAYFDWAQTPEGEYPGLCLAFSPDGIHWTKYPDAPRLKIAYGQGQQEVPFQEDRDRPWAVPLSMSDATDVFFDPIRQVYAWYGKMWIDGPDGRMGWKHAMGRTESTDFIHWSTPQLICAPDDTDPPHLEFHTTPVFYHANVYWCLNQLLNRGIDGGVIDIELMLSRDGINWQRPFRNQHFITRTNKTGFDSGSIFTNSTPIISDNEMHFYYGGYSQGATGADNDKQQSGIGRVSLPLDRFVGIAPLPQTNLPTQSEPVQKIGQITMKPATLQNCKQITINADASQGSIQVELLDLHGKRIRGFTQSEAVPIVGDALNHQVKWQTCDIAILNDGLYMLRIHLNNAIIYAIHFIS